MHSLREKKQLSVEFYTTLTITENFPNTHTMTQSKTTNEFYGKSNFKDKLGERNTQKTQFRKRGKKKEERERQNQHRQSDRIVPLQLLKPKTTRVKIIQGSKKKARSLKYM